MEKKIFAEFENIDSAEQAARWIKNSYESVRRIQISENTGERISNEHPQLFPNMGGPSSSIGGVLSDGVSTTFPADHGADIPIGTIYLSITADDGWQRIETTLRAFGGRKIHTINSGTYRL